MKQVALLLLLAAISQFAAACNRSSGNSLEVVQCLQEDHEKLSKELNRSYQKLLKDIVADSDGNTAYSSEEVKTALARAQEQWRGFIDSDCTAKFKIAQGGTGRNAVELNCLNTHMKQRIKELRKWSDD